MMKTTAWVAAAAAQPFVREALVLDEPRSDELRVRMVATGVCHTDAVVRDQWYPVPLPAVLGHEGAGIVEAVGSAVVGFAPGDHVLLSFNPCGNCDSCQQGKPYFCRNGSTRNFGVRRGDGSTAFACENGEPVGSHFFGQSSFATHANVSAHCAVKVPESAPLELLAPLGCGIQTGAGTVLNTLRARAGSSIAVFGAGAVGGAAILAAVVAGCTTIIAIDVVPARLELARSLGATHVVDSRTEDALQVIKDATGGRGADYAVDTTGVAAVFSQMTHCLVRGGHCALVGAAPAGTQANLNIGDLLTSGITITMVVEGDSVPGIFIPTLIDLYQQGRFPFDRLIRHYPIDEINQAFSDAESGVSLKPVLLHE